MQPKRQENRITGNWSGWVELPQVLRSIFCFGTSAVMLRYLLIISCVGIICWSYQVTATQLKLGTKKYNLTPDFLRGSQRAGRLALQSRWAYIEVTPELISWISVYALWRKCPRKIKQILMGEPRSEKHATLKWNHDQDWCFRCVGFKRTLPRLHCTIFVPVHLQMNWLECDVSGDFMKTDSWVDVNFAGKFLRPTGAKDGQR
jgi:hypothetical protein